MPPPSLDEIDVIRHREITSKAVGAILLLLLKWFKVSRTRSESGILVHNWLLLQMSWNFIISGSFFWILIAFCSYWRCLGYKKYRWLSHLDMIRQKISESLAFLGQFLSTAVLILVVSSAIASHEQTGISILERMTHMALDLLSVTSLVGPTVTTTSNISTTFHLSFVAIWTHFSFQVLKKLYQDTILPEYFHF